MSNTENVKNDEDIVQIKSFAFVNQSGGTGLSNWSHNKPFTGVSSVRVTKAWDDYEIGERFWGESADPALTAYMDEVGNKDDRRILFGVADLVNPSVLDRLMAKFNSIEAVLERAARERS